MERFDVVVIGAGIVGLAAAAEVAQRRPSASMLVLEKEPRVAMHQTGRNSGVVHSGVYYRPGSLKARLVADGRRALFDFCRDAGVPFDECGKVIVATKEQELEPLRGLEERGRANGLQVEIIGPGALRDLEPEAAGVAALHVPEAAIVDFGAVSAALATALDVRCGVRVRSLDDDGDRVTVDTTAGVLSAGRVVNCAGLHVDRLAAALGPERTKIIPFRGEYYELRRDRAHLVRNLVYPVPDPAFPFLGVHFTRMMNGSVHAGPNAVLAFAREGYRWRDVDARDLAELARHRGLRRFARIHWRAGAGELHRSLRKAAFVRALQRLVPAVSPTDLVRSRSGVRAQAMAPDGTLLDDFAFADSGRTTHVLNAPSPAATAALAIAREIVDRLRLP